MSEEGHNIEFDRNIKDRLQDYRPEVPEHLWQPIDNQAALLETEHLRKKVGAYKWVSAILILIIAGVITLYEWPDSAVTVSNLDHENTVVDEQQLVLDEEKTLYAEEVEEVESMLLNTEEGEMKSNNEKSKNEKDEIIESVPVIVTTVNPIKKTKKISPQPEYNDQPVAAIETEIVKEPTPEEGPLLADEETIPMNLDDELAADSRSNLKRKIEEEMDVPDKEEQPEIAEQLEKDLPAEMNLVIDEPATPLIKEQEESKELLAPEEEQTIALVEEMITEDMDTIPPDVEEATAAPVAQKHSGKLAAALLIYPVLLQTKMDEGTGFANTALYKQDAKNSLQWSPSLMLSYKLSRGLSINIGVSQSSLEQEYEILNARPAELPISIDADNKTLEVYSMLGTTKKENINSIDFAGDDEDDEDLDDEDDFANLNYKESYAFSYIHVPLTVGYEFGKGKLKTIGLVGANLTFVRKSHSTIELSNALKSTNIATIEDYHQTKSMMTGLTVGIGVKYAISNAFSAVIIPQYNYSFSNMLTSGSSSIKPHSLAFPLGVQYNF